MAKEESLIAESDRIEILILGNSRSFYGIDPHQFDLYSFNAAQVYQSLYFDKRITIKHLDRLSKLKYVIIPLDFHSFSYSSQTDVRNIWSYYANGIKYKDHIPLPAKISRAYGYTKKITFNFLLKDVAGKFKKTGVLDLNDHVDVSTPISRGYYYFYGTNESGMSESYCRERAFLFNDQVKQSAEKREVRADFEDFISLLQKKGIAPVLVTIPCNDTFRKFVDKELLERSRCEIKEIASKYSLSYFDYFDLNLDKSDWLDCDHLNNEGAIKFSKLLNSKLIEGQKGK